MRIKKKKQRNKQLHMCKRIFSISIFLIFVFGIIFFSDKYMTDTSLKAKSVNDNDGSNASTTVDDKNESNTSTTVDDKNESNTLTTVDDKNESNTLTTVDDKNESNTSTTVDDQNELKTTKNHSKDEVLHSGIIYDGLYLDEVDVSGLDYENAISEYKKYISNMGKRKVIIKDDLGSVETTFEKLGLEVNYEDAVCEALTYGRKGNILTRYKNIITIKNDNVTIVPEKTIDEKKLKQILSEETDNITKTPVNATMIRSDGEFVVYPSEKGLGINYGNTIALVKSMLKEKWNQKDFIFDAVTTVLEPTYSEDDFYGVDSLLGRAVTEYSNRNPERIGNLVVGAKKIADNVVFPGQQFSVYNTVAPFTEENGYQNAGQYINAELVDGLGGGICQVATTLYDAVLEAELQVDERYPHSMTVSYVKKGMDAAIAEGYQDFKFTNNTDYPIYIDAYAGGGTISVAIYGHETRVSNRRIEFESQVIETYEPGEDKTVYDDTLPSGTTNVTEAHTGYYVELWKHIYEDGELVDSVKVNGSQYSAIPKTTRIGTMTE